MTEDEAKTKWCPIMANIGGKQTKTVSDGVTEQTVIDLKGFRCVASDCMMWRQTETNPPGAGFDQAQGHCGLAGNPS